MAKYRKVHQKIWKDPDFQKYTPEGKLLFIYLCTNDATTESGIYALTPFTVAGETGIGLTSVEQLLSNGLKNIVYDLENNYVYIRNFRIYNPGGRTDLISLSVINDFKENHTPLWDLFFEDHPEYKDIFKEAGICIGNKVFVKGICSGNGSGICNGSGIGICIEPLSNGLTTVVQPIKTETVPLQELPVTSLSEKIIPPNVAALPPLKEGSRQQAIAPLLPPQPPPGEDPLPEKKYQTPLTRQPLNPDVLKNGGGWKTPAQGLAAMLEKKRTLQ